MPNNDPDYISPDDRRRLNLAHSVHEARQFLLAYHGSSQIAMRIAAALNNVTDYLWQLPNPALGSERQAAADKLRKAKLRAKAATTGGEVQR